MRHQLILAAAGGLVTCGSAFGAFVELETPVIVVDDSMVNVEFVGGFAGDIYFLGATSPTAVGAAWAAAADTGEAGLGLLLFGSADAPGERVDLGAFAAGSVLHFGLHVVGQQEEFGLLADVMRSHVDGDVVQFGWDEQASGNGRLRLGWEQDRDPKDSDWDYDDAAFDVIFTPAGGPDAPAPGGTVLLGLGGALATRRRR